LVIKRIYKVIDAWLNYYHHTDYMAGIEKIQECFNERVQRYIEKYQQNEKMVQLDNFVEIVGKA